MTPTLLSSGRATLPSRRPINRNRFSAVDRSVFPLTIASIVVGLLMGDISRLLSSPSSPCLTLISIDAFSLTTRNVHCNAPLWIERRRKRSIHISTTTATSILPSNSLRHVVYPFELPVKKNDGDHSSSSSPAESDGGAGMDDAFKRLEELTSLGDNDDGGMDGDEYERTKKRKDEAFARAMEKLNLKDMIGDDQTNENQDKTQGTTSTLESEIELYKDMAEELSVAESEEDIILDLKEDILSATSPSDNDPSEMTTKFMDKAIDEALKEVQEQQAGNDEADTAVPVTKESFLDNEEIMTEIEKIFDKASGQLLEGIEEIRTEQMEMARQSAERSAKETQTRMEEEEQRLAAAEANMQKMLSRVNEETQNVERAVEQLKQAQIESEKGLDGQLIDLKSGGLVKQATLVGSLLFTFRAGIETVGFLAGDVSHALPAIIQGAIAIVCLAGFLFL